MGGVGGCSRGVMLSAKHCSAPPPREEKREACRNGEKIDLVLISMIRV